MNDAFPPDSERLEELQAASLLFGLTPQEQEEYSRLVGLAPDAELQPLETVVAALDAAWSEMESERLPDHLRTSIRIRLERETATHSHSTAPEPSQNRSSFKSVRDFVPWLVAAACLALAVFSRFSLGPGAAPVLNVAQAREQLLAAGEDLIRVDLAPGTTPLGNAKGDVVWSKSSQRGFLRFRGLPVNSPEKEQYQLWIFDRNQSDKTPIDGGVFDIESEEEAIVRIEAKLKVQEPFMFAVTIEKPGGVVVSSRQRLPLIAKVE